MVETQCVQLLEGSFGDCAIISGGYAESGFFDEPVTITLDDTWPTWTYAGRLRTLLQEFGHALGLGNNSACTAAIMNDNFSCTGSPSTTLTMTDYLPVEKTTYGDGSMKTCGF